MSNFTNDFTLLGEKIDEEISTLKSQNEILENQNKSKNLTIKNYENVIKNYEKEIEEIKADNRSQEEQINALDSLVEGQKVVIERLSNRLKNLESENEILKESNCSLTLQVNTLSQELENTKKSIILSTDNANRTGRKPSLTENDIEYIKACRSEGLTIRKIAEMIDKSVGTVHKAVNNQYTTNKDNGGNEDMGQMRVNEPPKDREKLERSIFALKGTMKDDLKLGDTKSYELHKQALDVYEKALGSIENKEEQFTEDTTDYFGSDENKATDFFGSVKLKGFELND